MAELTRSALIDSLEQWGAYVQDFKSLSPDRQAAFLREQGFAALQDLLGHVIGWWEEGLRVIDGVKADPSFVYDEPDTDAFNAMLVEKFRTRDETAALDDFEKTRRSMVELANRLPDELLATPLVRDWLLADVVEHLEEHRLPG